MGARLIGALGSMILVASGSLTAQPAAGANPSTSRPIEAISIAAWDSGTGDLGIALESSFTGAGAVVPYARANVGAIVTQADANPEFGALALGMLSRGLGARQAVEGLIQQDSAPGGRQLAIVDAHGGSFASTGSGCLRYAGNVAGRGYVVLGCGLPGEGALKAAARVYESAPGGLAARLIMALKAGEAEGGVAGGSRSAALLVVRTRGGYGGLTDRLVDIRVDDNSLPLAELERIYWRRESAPPPPQIPQAPASVEDRLRAIDQFNKDKNYSAAREEMLRVVDEYNSELRAHPDDAELLNRVAWSLSTYEIDKDRALQLAKRATALAPGNPHMLNTLAECHYRLGHFDEAIAIESELAAKEPANDEYWKQLQKFKDARQKLLR
jgi:uncharacterized Ntn-hydrolase superfamily protein